MSKENSYPRIVQSDLDDPNLFRLNSIMGHIIGNLANVDDKANENTKEIRRVKKNYIPPSVQGAESGTGTPEAPDPLKAEEFDITLAPVGDNSPYGAKPITGEPIALFRLTVNVNPGDVTTFGVWGCEDVADPAPEDFKDLGVNFRKADSGATTGDFWLDRKVAGSTWKFVCIPSSSTWAGVPTDECVVKTVVVDAVDAPAQVTGFSVTMESDSGYRGRLIYSFTKPVDPEYWCTDVYRLQYTDNTFTTPIVGKDWSIVASMIDPLVQQEWWSLPPTTEYWSFRAETVSRAEVHNTVSRPISNLTVPAASLTPGDLPNPPARLLSGEFDIALAPAGDNSPYGAKPVTGEPIVKMRLTVTADPTDVLTWGVWGVEDNADPDPSDFKDLGVNFTLKSGGTTGDFWLDRQIAGSTWKFVCIPSNALYLGVPTVSDVIKTVVVDAVDAPAQVTGFSVTMDPATDTQRGRFVFNYTKPADPEYWTCDVYAIQCTDDSYVPIVGANWSLVSSSIDAISQVEWWSLPVTTEYWKFRAQSISRAGVINTTARPESNLQVPAAIGSEAALPDPPARLLDAEFTIELAPVGTNSPFRVKQVTGEPEALFRLTVTANPTDVTTWSVWGIEDVGSPTPTQFRNLGVNFTKATVGSTVGDFALDRKITGSTWKFVCVPNTALYLGAPTGTDAIKTVTVQAVGAPGQVTGFTAQVITSDQGGVPSGHMKFTWTSPTDPEYWTTHIFRIPCNSSFVPVPGYDWEDVFNKESSFEQSDWFPLGTGATYYQFKTQTLSRAGVFNTTVPAGQPVNVTVPGTTGIDLSKAKASSIDPSLTNSGGTLKVTPTPDPNAPTNLTLSVNSVGYNFGYLAQWTAPVTLGTTTRYAIEVRYYHSSTIVDANADTDWMPLGEVIGGSSTSQEFGGTWPRPKWDQWVMARIAAVNKENVKTSWVLTASATKLDKTPGVDLSNPDPSTLGEGLVVVDGKLSFTATTPPNDITITRVDLIDTISSDGKATKTCTVTYTPPVNPDFSGVWVYVDHPDSSGELFLADGTVTADGTVGATGVFTPESLGFKPYADGNPTFTFTLPAPATAEYWRLYCASGTPTYQVPPVEYGYAGATPSYQFTANPPSKVSGREFAPLVKDAALSSTPAGWTANPNYTTSEAGAQSFQVQVQWAWPGTIRAESVDSAQTGDVLVGTVGDVELVLDDGISRSGHWHVSPTSQTQTFVLPVTAVPYQSTAYRLWVVSRDTNGQANSIVAGVTPSVSFTISRQQGDVGVEYTKNPTNVNWFVGANAGSDGTAFLEVLVSGTDPDDPAFAGYELWVKRGVMDPESLKKGARGLPLRWQGQNPIGVETWIFYLRAMDTSMRLNSIAPSTPQYSTSVGSATGTLNLGRASSTTYSNQFKVVGSVFQVDTLDAGLVKTGALQVGGPGMVSQSKWFDQLGSLIGFWGDNTADPTPANRYVGLWSKVFRFGGADPTTWKISGDASGAVTMNGVTLSLNLNGTVTEINNALYDSIVWGLKCATGSTYAGVHGEGFSIWNGSSFSVALSSHGGLNGLTLAYPAYISVNGNGGATGTFHSQEGRLISVTCGIITAL